MSSNVKKIQIELSVSMDLDQIKQLALTAAGDSKEVIQFLVQVTADALEDTSLKGAYIEWHADRLDDRTLDWIWQKYNNRPFKSILAMQELVQSQYGILDRLAAIE